MGLPRVLQSFSSVLDGRACVGMYVFVCNISFIVEKKKHIAEKQKHLQVSDNN